jgi:hypothetical protein
VKAFNDLAQKDMEAWKSAKSAVVKQLANSDQLKVTTFGHFIRLV